jgi:hypothetical protein
MLNPNPAEKNQTSTGIIVRTAVDDIFLKKTMTDWLEANKIIADTLHERMEVKLSQGKPFTINYDTTLTPSKFYYPGFP